MTDDSGVSGEEERRRLVDEVLARHGFRSGSVRLLGAGLDNAAYDVDGELVARIVTDPTARGRVKREARLLRVVATASPPAVPVPVAVDPARGCLVHRKVPGSPLLGARLTAPQVSRLAATLGGFLARLHALSTAELTGLLEVDDTPAAEWLADAADLYEHLGPAVPEPYRPRVEAFLAAPAPDLSAAPVPAHNDLGIEHVLVDGGHVTGIIDWSDAALTDPARDLARLHRDLGDEALAATLDAYGATGAERDGLARRSLFYARCSVLEDLAHGLDTGEHEYARKSLAGLAWLFPDG